MLYPLGHMYPFILDSITTLTERLCTPSSQYFLKTQYVRINVSVTIELSLHTSPCALTIRINDLVMSFS